MTNMQVTTEILDVVIIGAGWYGLKAARTYLDLEPTTNLKIFDGDSSVGGVWSKRRIYPNLVAQVGYGYFNYPGYPMPEDGKPVNNLVSGDMINRYMEGFARDNGILPYISFNSWVDKVERCPRGWRLTINGGSRIYESSKLILASGVTSVPNKIPFEVESGAAVSHSGDIASQLPAIKRAQHIVIVGAAKSAYDAAYLLCSMGKKVTWVIRPDGSGPMPIMPHEIGGMNTITVGCTRLMTYLSPSMFNTKTLAGSFFHRTFLGRWLTKSHWNFITGLSEKAAGFGGKAGPVESLVPDVADKSCFWCDSSLGLITMTDFWDALKRGNIQILRDNVDIAAKDCVVLRTGNELKCDYVINATGWGDHFAYLSAELKDELGIPQYSGGNIANDEKTDFWCEPDRAAEESVRKSIPLLDEGPKGMKWHPDRQPTKRRWRLYNRCIPIKNAINGDRSFAILGQIHTTQTPTIAGIQSLWAISYLLGEMNLPSEKEMVREVAEYQAWVRLRYQSVGERYPYALFDWIGYLDRLLSDIKIQNRRKSNFISEFFAPYGPHTYAECLNEYIAKRAQHKKPISLRTSGDISSDDDVIVKKL